jgi:hypothetical protein
MSKPKYSYAPRGNQWAVLEWDFHPNGSSGTVIAYYNKIQDAKDLAKHLNETEPKAGSELEPGINNH